MDSSRKNWRASYYKSIGVSRPKDEEIAQLLDNILEQDIVDWAQLCELCLHEGTAPARAAARAAAWLVALGVRPAVRAAVPSCRRDRAEEYRILKRTCALLVGAEGVEPALVQRKLQSVSSKAHSFNEAVPVDMSAHTSTPVLHHKDRRFSQPDMLGAKQQSLADLNENMEYNPDAGNGPLAIHEVFAIAQERVYRTLPPGFLGASGPLLRGLAQVMLEVCAGGEEREELYGQAQPPSPVQTDTFITAEDGRGRSDSFSSRNKEIVEEMIQSGLSEGSGMQPGSTLAAAEASQHPPSLEHGPLFRPAGAPGARAGQPAEGPEPPGSRPLTPPLPTPTGGAPASKEAEAAARAPGGRDGGPPALAREGGAPGAAAAAAAALPSELPGAAGAAAGLSEGDPGSRATAAAAMGGGGGGGRAAAGAEAAAAGGGRGLTGPGPEAEAEAYFALTALAAFLLEAGGGRLPAPGDLGPLRPLALERTVFKLALQMRGYGGKYQVMSSAYPR